MRGTLSCCARATSGQAAAVPPSRVMNSRRLMGFVLGLRTAPYHTVERELCFAAQRHRPFMSELGQTATSRNARVTSGLPPIPDIRRRPWHGSFVPSRHKFHILSGCTLQLVCYFAYGMEPDAGHRILNRRCSLSAICSAGPEWKEGDSTGSSSLLLTPANP